MIKVGVIGYGYWGPNLVRNFMAAPDSAVGRVCDLREERLAPLQKLYPGIKTCGNSTDLINDPQIDAVVIATPVSSHFDLALAALKAGKHVLVEKPLAANSDQARQLIDEAAARKLVLLVDHTFVYTDAVRKIRELISSGQLGEIYYYDAVRVNLGLFQHDVNVIWDLAIHDLSIMDAVLPAKPVAISTTGISHIPGQPENVAYITLFFAGPQIAHVHVNWLTPVKVRHTLIGGSEKMILYDDLDPSEKLKVYDKGISVTPRPEDVYKMLVSYRSGDMYAPRLDNTEALQTEALHFIDCVQNNRQPETDGAAGLRMVQMIEAAEKSLRDRGRLIELQL
ncbi:MAG: Gfo/Idh/MocA family oxidoreductase [Acidobacteria bacterium]|nr:Gfo/Idh/MocA family oxidoreductase [Acidobacteriota bacterium]MCA1627798.1 Gfo/Idh/MocA family oxidoreductase [Acidobacteriota bacterium]